MFNTLGFIIIIVVLTTAIVSGIVVATMEVIESIKLSKEIKKYKSYYHYIYAKSLQHVIARENSSWELLELDHPNNTYECVMEIIDDATCYGFEFKVDNGKIYFRELPQEKNLRVARRRLEE